MGFRTDRLVRLFLWIALAGVAAAIFAIQTGCASANAFDAPDVVVTGIHIPVPPAELECSSEVGLALRELTLDAVQSDGSVIVRACTHDVLALSAQVLKDRQQCEAHNAARLVVIEAQERAEAELKRLQDELESQ